MTVLVIPTRFHPFRAVTIVIVGRSILWYFSNITVLHNTQQQVYILLGNTSRAKELLNIKLYQDIQYMPAGHCAMLWFP